MGWGHCPGDRWHPAGPTLVRPPCIQSRRDELGSFRFAVVSQASAIGIRSNYLVDTYGTTLATLEGDPSKVEQDAVQDPPDLDFRRGELVAVRAVNGLYQISKLGLSSLRNKVTERGKVWVCSTAPVGLQNDGVDFVDLKAQAAAGNSALALGTPGDAGGRVRLVTFTNVTGSLFPFYSPWTNQPYSILAAASGTSQLVAALGLQPAQISYAYEAFWAVSYSSSGGKKDGSAHSTPISGVADSFVLGGSSGVTYTRGVTHALPASSSSAVSEYPTTVSIPLTTVLGVGFDNSTVSGLPAIPGVSTGSCRVLAVGLSTTASPYSNATFPKTPDEFGVNLARSADAGPSIPVTHDGAGNVTPMPDSFNNATAGMTWDVVWA